MWELIQALATIGLAAIGLYALVVAVPIVLMVGLAMLGAIGSVLEGIASVGGGNAETPSPSTSPPGAPKTPPTDNSTTGKGGWSAVGVAFACLAALSLLLTILTPLLALLTRGRANNVCTLGMDCDALLKPSGTNDKARPSSEAHPSAAPRRALKSEPSLSGRVGACSSGGDCMPAKGGAPSTLIESPLPQRALGSQNRGSSIENDKTEEPLWFATPEALARGKAAACRNKIPMHHVVVHDSASDSWFLVLDVERRAFDEPQYVHTPEELETRLQRAPCPW